MAIITLILEVVVLLGQPLLGRVSSNYFFVVGLGLAPLLSRLMWFTIIARDSKIFTTLIGYLIVPFFFIFWMGLLAKLEHWYWAFYAIALGSCGVLILYTIHFVLKKNKLRLDFFKYLFVFSYFIVSLLILEHWISPMFKYGYIIVFYVLIFLFALKKDKGELPKEAFSFEHKNE